MSDDALGVDDDTSEMRKIESLADIRIVRYLEMILTAQLVESVIAYGELNLVELLPYAVKSVDLVSIEPRASHNADIAEFRGRSSLFEIACVDVLIAACITGVSEQIGIDYVFKFICHDMHILPHISILKFYYFSRNNSIRFYGQSIYFLNLFDICTLTCYQMCFTLFEKKYTIFMIDLTF